MAVAAVAAGAAAGIVEIAATGAIAAIAGSDFLLPNFCEKRLPVVDVASHASLTLDAVAPLRNLPPLSVRAAALQFYCLRNVTVS
jgi:hypothetical protein